VLKNKQKRIFIRDVDIGKIQKCTITTAGRYGYEKYITKGWNDYKIERGLRAGDIVRFNIEEPPQYVNVRVIRN
jgi:hypothetical protein